MIRHSVHLKFRPDVSSQTKLQLYKELDQLRHQIDGILDFQHRQNVSVELDLVRGFNDMFWFDFENEAVRNVYLEDPTHKAIGSQIVAKLEGGADGVFVCDIEV